MDEEDLLELMEGMFQHLEEDIDRACEDLSSSEKNTYIEFLLRNLQHKLTEIIQES